MLLVHISLFPLDKGISLSKYVARSMEIIEKSGLEYTLGAMGTTIEGEYEDVFGVIKKCFDAISEDSDRVSMYIKADWRRGGSGRLKNKVRSVEDKLGRKLVTEGL